MDEIVRVVKEQATNKMKAARNTGISMARSIAGSAVIEVWRPHGSGPGADLD